MSDKQNLSYCTYCGDDVEPRYTIDVSIKTKAEVDGESLGYIDDNYSLCSYECLEKVLEDNTDLYEVENKVRYFKEEIADRVYRMHPINEGDNNE